MHVIKKIELKISKMRTLLLQLFLILSLQFTFSRTTIKILNFQGDNGFVHDSKDEALDMIEQLGTKNGWDIRTITNASVLNVEDIAHFDVIVFNNNCGNEGRIFSDEQQQALKQYIRNGGGFVGIHCAGAIWKEGAPFQRWYEQLVGARMVTHPPVQQAKLIIENQSHISTAHLKEVWEIKDEWHTFSHNPRENVNVLISLDENSYEGIAAQKMGGDHPFTWYQHFEGGRSFFTSLGHTKEIYNDANYQKMIEGGILWASGNDETKIISSGLILDLNADAGVSTGDNNKVIQWKNQVEGFVAQDFVINNDGLRLSNPGSGRPTIKTNLHELNGHNTIIFEEDELINMQEDAFDHLTQGNGYTWFAVVKPYTTPLGETEFKKGRLKDVNAFFGNLKNGGLYEGFWGAFDDNLTVWSGSRNAKTMGRFDKNNPKITGPKLEANQYYILAGRMGAGTDTVQIDLFVNNALQVASSEFPVNPLVNPSMMAIGTERNATNHPGTESFDGEIGRFLIYERPLTNDEMGKTITYFKEEYKIMNDGE